LARQPKRKRSQLTPLENGLAEVLGAEKLSRLADISRLQRCWPEIVGPMLSTCTRPITIETGCLLIAVNHSTTAQQIRFLQQEIRDACFHKCGVKGISRLRTHMRSDIAVQNPGQKIKPAMVPLSQKKKIAAELRDVENSKLKRAIYKSRVAQKAFKN